MIIFPHIQKTGGRTATSYLIEIFGPDRVYQYNQDTNSFLKSSDNIIDSSNVKLRAVLKDILLRSAFGRSVYKYIWDSVREGALDKGYTLEQIPVDAVLVGHFNPLEIGITDTENHTYLTLVRDPLERMWSLYNFLMQEIAIHGAENVPESAWFNNTMSFEKFALSDHTRNHQVRYLEGIPRDRIIFGVTHRMEDFVRGICSRFEIQRDIFDNRVANKTVAKPGIPQFEKDFLRQFRQSHSKDYELYEYAKARAEEGELRREGAITNTHAPLPIS